MCPSQIVTLMLFPYVMGFENAVDKRKALQEMFRVLRPGGRTCSGNRILYYQTV